MRKLVTFCLVVTAALCLTAAAHADVISLGGMLVLGVLRLLPYLLVAAVVVVTFLLLRKFRK